MSMRKEVEVMREMFPNAKRFFMNAVTDLPTDEDHNYKNYYSSFQRTIRKHLLKLKDYKKIIQIKRRFFSLLMRQVVYILKP